MVCRELHLSLTSFNSVIPILSPLVFMPSLYSSFLNSKNIYYLFLWHYDREGKSIIESKAVVDEFLAGRQVSISDIFRLGKYTQSDRPRPLLVKLSAVWDRKLLLSQKKNLREFRIRRLFLREDVPPENRLRQRRSRPSTDIPGNCLPTSRQPSFTFSQSPTRSSPLSRSSQLSNSFFIHYPSGVALIIVEVGTVVYKYD